MLKAPRQVQRLAPQAIEQAFIDANANLHADNMAVTCARGELVDVRICLTEGPQGLRDLSESLRAHVSARLGRRPAAALTGRGAACGDSGRDGPIMNYRHAFHAGNFADVMKHAVLARILVYLTQKDAPLRFIDTHAGAGRYDLASAEARRSPEWRDGIARVLKASPPAPIARLLAPYLRGGRPA